MILTKNKNCSTGNVDVIKICNMREMISYWERLIKYIKIP